jgi:two-component system cell cycle response regulator
VRRARQLATLASTLDLDELLQQVLRAAVAVSGADAAALVFPQSGAPPIEKTLNLAPEEAAPSLEGLWSENRARSVAVRYRYAGREAGGARDPIRSALVVPLAAGDDEPIGTLAAYWRQDADEPGDDELAALEELAASSARAIENALRFREVHQLAVRDALTGLYNRRFFDETLAREVKRAHRYDRSLALIVFDLDGFKAINDRVGHLGGDAVLTDLGARLRSVVRGADVPCRIGGDEFAVILPEAAAIDGEQLFQRFQLALDGRGGARTDGLQLSAGVAELHRDDDHVSLYRRADQALLAAKRAGRGRVFIAD